MTNETALEMFVGGLVLDPSTQAPIVVLKDESGQVTLPIWIGMAEATSIASAIKQVTMARPLTHDLFYELLLELGTTVQRVVITELRESTYFAELIMAQGDRIFVMDARPSDAIAMALRASAPIFVSQQVLEHARKAFSQTPQVPEAQETGEGGVLEEGEEVEGAEGSEEVDEEIVPFDPTKDFKNIEKEKWEEILRQLDPEDFKYKV
jgi:bifunctional DNase/RNase